MKNLLIAILVFIIAAASVFAADSVSVTEPVLTVVQGESAVGTFTVTNNGDTNLTDIDFAISELVSTTDAAHTIDVATVPGSIDLDEGESQELEFAVSVSAAQAAETYEGVITTGYNFTDYIDTKITVIVAEPTYDIQDLDVSFPQASAGDSASVTFKVKNSGNQELNNIALTHDADPEYNLNLTPDTILNLLPGEEAEITATMTIPDDEEQGDRKVATVTMAADEYSETFEIREDISTKLKITRVDVIIDGSSDNDIDSGDTVEDKAEPESTIKFEVTVENMFTDSQDIKIKDVFARITIEEIDDGDDIDEESRDFNLEAEEDDMAIVEMDIPLEVEEDKYKVIIEAEGEDEDGNEHTDEFELYFKVDKVSHEVRIMSAELLPNDARCGEQIRIPVKIVNLGTSSEDEVVIQIFNSELGIDYKEEDIELEDDPFDRDSKYTNTYTIDIPEDSDSGNYNIDVKVYYKEDTLSDLKRMVLQLDCAAPTTTTMPTTTTEPTTTTFSVTTTTENGNNSFFGGNAGSIGWKAALIALDIIATVAVILMVIYILKRRSDAELEEDFERREY